MAKKPASNAPPLAVNQPNPPRERDCAEGLARAWAAVVLTLSVAVALAELLMVTEVVAPAVGAVNEQVISDPGEAQLRVTVPVKPVPGVIVMVDVPEPPGAEIVAVLPETVNPPVMVSVMAAEVEPA